MKQDLYAIINIMNEGIIKVMNDLKESLDQ